MKQPTNLLQFNFFLKIKKNENLWTRKILRMEDSVNGIGKLEVIVFGSVSSQDYDLIVNVKRDQTNEKVHTYNLRCQELDRELAKIYTDKPVNSSLGCWEDGVLLWSQKGSDTAEVNNGIIKTFHLHKQMFTECPLRFMQPRNLMDKILTTTRDVLCKCNKSILLGDMTDFICKALAIPEIRSQGEHLVYTLLKGYFVSKSLCKKIPSLQNLCANKKRKQNQIAMYKAIYAAQDKYELVRNLLVQNQKDKQQIDNLLENLDSQELKDELKNETEWHEIKLNRLVRQLRKIRTLGPRLDIIELLDFTKVRLATAEDKYKNIVFKVCQTIELANNNEIYTKEEIINIFPHMYNFIYRQPITDRNLHDLQNLIRSFLHIARTHPDYSRQLLEIL